MREEEPAGHAGTGIQRSFYATSDYADDAHTGDSSNSLVAAVVVLDGRGMVVVAAVGVGVDGVVGVVVVRDN